MPESTKRKSDDDKQKPALRSLEGTINWENLPLDGLGNKALGRVAGIHVDAEDRKPRWVLIRLGPLAGCTAIPFEHVAEGAGRLWAAYERDWIREAPRFRPNESLTRDQELELCAHWGVREGQGRAAELAGKDADAITAVPAKE
jgi:hypothetical protein